MFKMPTTKIVTGMIKRIPKMIFSRRLHLWSSGVSELGFISGDGIGGGRYGMILLPEFPPSSTI